MFHSSRHQCLCAHTRVQPSKSRTECVWISVQIGHGVTDRAMEKDANVMTDRYAVRRCFSSVLQFLLCAFSPDHTTATRHVSTACCRMIYSNMITTERVARSTINTHTFCMLHVVCCMLTVHCALCHAEWARRSDHQTLGIGHSAVAIRHWALGLLHWAYGTMHFHFPFCCCCDLCSPCLSEPPPTAFP